MQPAPARTSDKPDNGSRGAPGITLAGIRLAYGGTTLIDGLDLTLAAGRWTCLLGPSGVGKTSLLRVIAGLEADAHAEIGCSDGGATHGRVAYMAQRDNLLPWLDLLGNAVIGVRLRGGDVRSARDRAAALLERVGLREDLATLPDACSGGMRQRAALVRTLVEDRPIVLMDEPFSALDAITRLDLQTLAAELLRDRTVLLVTHDPLEALRLGDRIHVMTGRPATLSAPFLPSGAAPRPPSDPELLRMHAGLLDRLASGAVATMRSAAP